MSILSPSLIFAPLSLWFVLMPVVSEWVMAESAADEWSWNEQSWNVRFCVAPVSPQGSRLSDACQFLESASPSSPLIALPSPKTPEAVPAPRTPQDLHSCLASELREYGFEGSEETLVRLCGLLRKFQFESVH